MEMTHVVRETKRTDQLIRREESGGWRCGVRTILSKMADELVV